MSEDDEGFEPPLRALGVIAAQEVTIAPGLDHLELYTMQGLLTVLWHGDHDAEHVVLACGGAMGGVLGPAEGLYHDLGVRLAEVGIGLLRVGWRRPNDLERCTLDLTAAADLASRRGRPRLCPPAGPCRTCSCGPCPAEPPAGPRARG